MRTLLSQIAIMLRFHLPCFGKMFVIKSLSYLTVLTRFDHCVLNQEKMLPLPYLIPKLKVTKKIWFGGFVMVTKIFH